MEDCPIPEVGDALRPFIRPRDEVSRIRSELQTHLQRQVNGGKATLSSVTLAAPQQVSDSGPSSAITGVRKAYLRALQAHAAAQERYDTLKAELAQQSATAKDDGKQSVSSINDQYMPLLRQRERQRKLHVIDRTVSDLHDTGRAAVDGHLDDIVKQRAGDLPIPPTTQPLPFSEKPDVESQILQLKKAILSTKRSIDSHGVALSDARPNDIARGNADADIAGLQSALNELTGWMEHQLAIIGDAEGDAQAPPPTPEKNGHATPELASSQYIETLYEDYAAARERLIRIVSSPPLLRHNAVSPIAPRRQDAPQLTTAAETLVPFVESLTHARDQDQSLSQQSAYIRRQIASSEAETRRLIARLAGESHLVHPGAAKGKNWAEAATESAKATYEFVTERLDVGEASAGAAKKVLDDIERVPIMLDVLSAGTRV